MRAIVTAKMWAMATSTRVADDEGVKARRLLPPPQPAAVIAAARRASIDLNYSPNASSSSFRPVPSSAIFVAILIVVVALIGGGDGSSRGGGGFLDVLDGVIDVVEESVGRRRQWG